MEPRTVDLSLERMGSVGEERAMGDIVTILGSEMRFIDQNVLRILAWVFVGCVTSK